MLIQAQIKKLTIFTAAIFLLIVASLLNVDNMYLMAAVMALIPATSWVVGIVMMRGVRVTRRAQDYGTVGETSSVQLTVTNCSRFPKYLLRVTDYLPKYLRYAGTSDRDGGMLLWMTPGETAEVKYLLEPRLRGLYNIGPVKLYGSDPLGLWQYKRTVGSVDKLIVYPEVMPVGTDLFEIGMAHGWRDRDEAASQGSGTDFHGVRDYRVGDELRRINWKTTARTGQLAVTEFTQGFSGDITLVMDVDLDNYANTGEGPASAFEIAVKLAAAISAAVLSSGRELYFVTGTEIDAYLPALKGVADLPIILEALATINPVRHADLARNFGIVRRRAETAAQVVCIATVRAANGGLRDQLLSDLNSNSSPSFAGLWLDGDAFGSEAAPAYKSELPSEPLVSPEASTIFSGGYGTSNNVRHILIDPNTDIPALLGGRRYDNPG